jgi:endonuclease YncB( thermonuclease family)
VRSVLAGVPEPPNRCRLELRELRTHKGHMMSRLVMAVCTLLLGTAALFAAPIERSAIWVKDGDTIIKADGQMRAWTADEEYRLVGFDTPETARPRAKCASEIERGMAAAARLIAILDKGKIDLSEVQCACTERTHGTKRCNHGRRCARLAVDGKDVAETMIAEGHAVPLHCSETKCPRLKGWCGKR